MFLSKGRTTKEIAAALGLSPATVKRHIEKILTKLGLRNRVELAQLLLKKEVVERPDLQAILKVVSIERVKEKKRNLAPDESAKAAEPRGHVSVDGNPGSTMCLARGRFGLPFGFRRKFRRELT